MRISLKWKIITILLIIILVGGGGFLFFKYFFTYEQRNKFTRDIQNVTGQNLTVTIFGYDGKIIKRWINVKKITSGKDDRDYTYFYTEDGLYVQIPNSVWYVAEETKP